MSTVRGTAARRRRAPARSSRATFPPASVTGAPEAARAPGHRRPRAGAARCLLRRDRAGSTPTTGDADLAVAIRTFTVLGTATTAAPTSAWAAASSPTRQPDAEWARDRAQGSRAPRASRAPTRARCRVVTAADDAASSGSTARCSTADDARVSPFDHGLLVGDGVFETIRVYGGEPFAWTPSPRPARALGRRARARGPRPRAAARRRRRGARGERARTRRGCASRSPAASRRSVPSGARRRPTVIVASERGRAVAAVGRRSSSCRGCATTAARPPG